MRFFSDFYRIMAFKDVSPYVSRVYSFTLIPLSLILNLLKGLSDVLGPLAVATAVGMVSQDEEKKEILGIEFTPLDLLYTGAAIYAYGRSAQYLVRFTMQPIRKKMTQDVVVEVLNKTKKLSYEDTVKYKNELEQALQYTREVSELAQLIPYGIHQPLFSFITGTIILFVTSGNIAGGVFLAYVPLRLLTSFGVYYLLNIDHKNQETMNNFTKFNGRYKQTLSNVDLVKVFNHEDLEEIISEKLGGEYFAPYNNVANRQSLALLSTCILPTIADFSVLVGVSSVTTLQLGIDDILFILNFFSGFNTTSTRFVESCYTALKLMSQKDQINNVLKIDDEDHSAEIFDYHWLTAALSSAPSISFENVTFKYRHSDDQSVLDNVSFSIESGQRFAIVGSSGSGKSTIAKLLLRLYKPLAGEIKINGRNINTIPREELYRVVGILWQDVSLFESDNIEFNIGYGFFGHDNMLSKIYLNPARHYFNHEHADDFNPPEIFPADLGEEHSLQELLINSDEHHEAGLVAIINQYEFSKTNACIGDIDTGITPVVAAELSGGQRQRVGLARLLTRNPSIFFFDEPTASLDTETEEQVMQAINNNLNANKTIMIVAHRLHTIVDSDKIVVLEKGRVIQEGNHSTLIREQGKYSQLWRKQASLENAKYAAQEFLA